MRDLVQLAREPLGSLRPGFKYCFKIPGPLGGEKGGDNLATISLAGLVSVSWHIAQQIEDLPEGTQVKLSFSAEELVTIDQHAVDGGLNLWKKPSTEQRL